MQSYVALLRGINVGGNNIIKMLDLKECFEDMGFENVRTFIQSGNVIFSSEKNDSEKLEKEIEAALSKRFAYVAKVVVRSLPQLQKILKDVPSEWNHRSDIRCYIAFLKESLPAQQAVREIELAEGIDTIKAEIGVIYMTSLLSKLTRSKLNKLAAKKIYQDMTIRNYNTTKKIAALMEHV
jgi:uncharacterized protein (DUF1697 family)